MNFRVPYKAGLYVCFVVVDFVKCWASGLVKCGEMFDQLINYCLFNNWLVGDWFRCVMFTDECNGVNLFTWFSVRSSGRLF